MAANQRVAMKFEIDYGALVRVSHAAPDKWRPGKVGSVFSKYIVETQQYAKANSVAVGSEMIGIEFESGDAVEVPVEFVEPV